MKRNLEIFDNVFVDQVGFPWFSERLEDVKYLISLILRVERWNESILEGQKYFMS